MGTAQVVLVQGLSPNTNNIINFTQLGYYNIHAKNWWLWHQGARCEIAQLHSWAKLSTAQGPEWHALRIHITGIQGVAQS